ncbi:TetR/AcrR family transcriptional regulator [Saccharothrix coeruleofusca]|uniref:TetR family transcriptional regulator n=1 Tax=Saccharothrix coeruleofusca TaxID=33919 RepID=A0A918ARZ9_9PSEU|nr:TetR/AcrR family transcriptional regulator [Saccharothrix coeruleofusca]MBP2334964.1 AcrR family transcriptional regulator [Saccharothrix coeruleofusca]GGP68245.1 TetR family transcriptional regulator [Saccharothrix coeruleofusca]
MTTPKGAATRLRIVEAAAAEIRERGTIATTLDDVCRRSGTGKSQLFHYFPQGREQLLLAVTEFEAERVFQDQEPYLHELDSRTAWEAWRDAIVETCRDQGPHCPLGVLIADVGRYSPAAQAVTTQLIRRWQAAVRAGIEATRAAGGIGPDLDADRTAAAVITAIQGGVSVLLSTGSATHLEVALDLCLDHLFAANARPVG